MELVTDALRKTNPGRKAISNYSELAKELNGMDSKRLSEVKDVIQKDRYNEYGSSNITRIVRGSFFDATDLNKFERNVLARIFPFYNFLKVNMMNNLRRARRLDFRGLYGYER